MSGLWWAAYAKLWVFGSIFSCAGPKTVFVLAKTVFAKTKTLFVLMKTVFVLTNAVCAKACALAA